MTLNKNNLEITDPINQLILYGYKDYMDSLVKLYNNKKLPNVMLIYGPKGIGKSTFIYHFINYILSLKEKHKYVIDGLSINPDNNTYQKICNNIHPNFFLLDVKSNEENIKIDQVRNLINFTNKSTYLEDKKIIMINNAELLNLNSSNALLKVLEEPSANTHFFIIHNSLSKILQTIKSRCICYKVFFSQEKRKEIFNNIIKSYELDFNMTDLSESFFHETPGNLLNYLLFFNRYDSNLFKNKLEAILFLIEKYKSKKDYNILSYISTFIEHFYNDLFLSNNNINFNLKNRDLILTELSNIRKFNLDAKNFFINLPAMLKNEK